MKVRCSCDTGAFRDGARRSCRLKAERFQSARAVLQGFRRPLQATCAALVAVLLALGFTGCSKERANPNVVLVVLDTLRSDFTGPGGNSEGLTPQLDRLAEEGMVFENSWATSPWTLPSHATLFTGKLSSAHGCHINNWRLSEENPTLAEILSDAGYESAAFFSNPWLSDKLTGVLRGFETRQESPLSGVGGMVGERGDQGGQSINRNILEWLSRREGERPFFMFVNFLEPHLPYDPPLSYRKSRMHDIPYDDVVSIAWAQEYNAGIYPSELVDWLRIRRLYGGDVHATDAHLSTLISSLKRFDLYKEAVLIVTSDHGENLGDHGLMEHQFSVHETLLSVPLIVRAPGSLDRGVSRTPVMLTDVFATILDVAGVEEPELPKHSKSLLDCGVGGESGHVSAEEPDRFLFAEYGGGHASLVAELKKTNPGIDIERFKRAYKTVRQGDFRLTIASDGALWLHNLAEDPLQEEDLAGQYPEVVDKLREALVKNQSRELLPEGEPSAIDEEAAEKLRSLGYVK